MRSLKKTTILKIDPDNPRRKDILLCAEKIKKGCLVAFPTETVYGIAANLLDKNAIERLYKVKHRPRGKPFTVHIADLGTIRKMGCRIAARARAVMERYWPGPVTIILQSESGEKIGFRMPSNKIALMLIKAAKVPVVAPSANISGNTPPRDTKSILKDLEGNIDVIIDAGRTDIGVESTVVDMTVDPPQVLREGAVKREAIEKLTRDR